MVRGLHRGFLFTLVIVWLPMTEKVFFPFSASMGHINTIGSLERAPQAGSGGVAIGEMACRSMATLSRLAPYGEAPPPYEWTLSLSVEEVVSTGQTHHGSMKASV